MAVSTDVGRVGQTRGMELEFSGAVFQWRGPAPFFYVAVPDEQSETIKDFSSLLTYGWGCIPVSVRIGQTSFTTSLFPKDDRYLVPLKVAVRTAESIADGDLIDVRLAAEVNA